MNRRGFLKSILAAGVAPYVVTTAGVLMPVRDLWRPQWTDIETTFIDPKLKDRSDPLGQRGYVGARGVFDGKRYGVLFALDASRPYNETIFRAYAENHLKMALADPRARIPVGTGMPAVSGKVVSLLP